MFLAGSVLILSVGKDLFKCLVEMSDYMEPAYESAYLVTDNTKPCAPAY